MGALSQAEIDAAMGGFSRPDPAMSEGGIGPFAAGYGAPPAADVAAPMPDMYQHAAASFAPQAPMMSSGGPTPLDDAHVQAAQDSFRTPMAPPPPPPSPSQPAPPPMGAPGMSLAGKARADEQAYLGTFDAMKANKQAEANAVRDRGQGLEQRYAEEAAHEEQLARIQHDETLQAHNEHAKYMAETRAMMKDVAA